MNKYATRAKGATLVWLAERPKTGLTAEEEEKGPGKRSWARKEGPVPASRGAVSVSIAFLATN